MYLNNHENFFRKTVYCYQCLMHVVNQIYDADIRSIRRDFTSNFELLSRQSSLLSLSRRKIKLFDQVPSTFYKNNVI